MRGEIAAPGSMAFARNGAATTQALGVVSAIARNVAVATRALGVVSAIALGLLAAPARAQADAAVVVDAFDDASAWSAHPADGVALTIGSDTGAHGRALRLDVRFERGGGYAVARRAVALDLPENYRFRFAVRGEIPPENLEFKLIDSTGDNVWWSNRRDFQFPREWQTLSTRKRQIPFAWGPAGGGVIRHVAAIEVAITAGSGGSGTVWLDDLVLETLPPEDTAPPAPIARASFSRAGTTPAYAVDHDTETFWRSGIGDRKPTLTLDLGVDREFGGLIVDWNESGRARDYAIEISSDGTSWRSVREVREGGRLHDYLYLPESEARWLRLRALGPTPASGIAVEEIALQPIEWGGSLASFFQSIAKDAPPGSYPRAISGEQSYWTIVGMDGDVEEALLNEDGMLETGKAAWSIEPFLYTGGRLLSWHDVETKQTLEDGWIPIPSVRWRRDSLSLTVTAFATRRSALEDSAGGTAAKRRPGTPAAGIARVDGDSTVVVARYRVRNESRERLRATLFLALRPFQVNPPTQFLNTPGGVADLHELARDGSVIRANGNRGLVSLSPPSGFGAATFDEGDVVDLLRAGRLPPRTRVSDSFGKASGALAYRLDLPPGGERTVDIVVPLASRPYPFATAAPPASRGRGRNGNRSSPPLAAANTAKNVDRALAECRSQWKSHERGITVALPDTAREVARTLRAQLAYILINRDGPAIQPGSRSYERSWIRDGSLTSSALLRLGHADVVREFLEWFASYQYADGKVPCCVDRRGADPTAEHDSHGEFIYLAAEYYRYTSDRETVAHLWPAVAKAAGYIDALRQQRRTPEWRATGKREFYGLLPPSISHEGYSAKPMHSYWDDFFALRGLKDAVYLAGALGREPERKRFASIRDEFQRDLAASVRATMAIHKIDYVPGCADLGDFDATSTTIALEPAGAARILPPGAIDRTFERYWNFFRDRRDGKSEWDAFTPYEVRAIGSFVRLGRRDRANQLLDWFLKQRRPEGWAHWAEVVGRDPRAPRFIGDMPHTWVGSDFVRSVLDMLVYEREDGALVLGAGIPEAWTGQDPGVSVHDLPTPYGKLSYSMRETTVGTEVMIASGLRIPPAGIVVSPPRVKRMARARVNEVQTVLPASGELIVRSLPARILIER